MLPGTASTGRPSRSAWPTVFSVPLRVRASATQSASLCAAMSRLRARKVPVVQPGANAVTFVSADGTETMLPLGYVIGRHGVLSYEINEEALTASVGGSNQLWMTRTPANYFVRDVVEIVVSAEDEAPAVPGEADEHPNSPNAGVLTGAQE